MTGSLGPAHPATPGRYTAEFRSWAPSSSLCNDATGTSNPFRTATSGSDYGSATTFGSKCCARRSISDESTNGRHDGTERRHRPGAPADVEPPASAERIQRRIVRRVTGAFIAADDDDGVGVVVLTGGGRAFSAGPTSQTNTPPHLPSTASQVFSTPSIFEAADPRGERSRRRHRRHAVRPRRSGVHVHRCALALSFLAVGPGAGGGPHCCFSPK